MRRILEVQLLSGKKSLEFGKLGLGPKLLMKLKALRLA
jgi:hypothetical protein